MIDIIKQALEDGKTVHVLSGGMGHAEDVILIDGLPLNMWPANMETPRSELTNLNPKAAQYAKTTMGWGTESKWPSCGSGWIRIARVNAGEILLAVGFGDDWRSLFMDWLGRSPRDAAIAALRSSGPYRSVDDITAIATIAKVEFVQPRVNFANAAQRSVGAVIGVDEWLALEKATHAADNIALAIANGHIPTMPSLKDEPMAHLFERVIEGVLLKTIRIDWDGCPECTKRVLVRALKHATLCIH